MRKMDDVIRAAVCAAMAAVASVGCRPDGGDAADGAARADCAKTLRLMSYNINHCKGADGRVDVGRTAAAIMREKPDFVGLQEVDVGVKRSGRADQPEELARLTGFHATFAEAMPMPKGGSYGVAVLSREKPLSVRRIPLPGHEPRVLLLCEFEDLWFATTHLDAWTLPGDDEPANVKSVPLVRREIERCAAEKPVFLTGDWNAVPDSGAVAGMRGFLAILSDVGTPTNGDLRRCIDYVAVDAAHAGDFAVRGSRATMDRETSNHLPVTVEVAAGMRSRQSRPSLAEFPRWSEPRTVTHGPREHLLASYFAIDSWSPDGRRLLVLETDVNGRLPEAGERCTLGFVDLADGDRFVPVTTTACWNFQEAAMAHWMDDDTIIFNDVRGGAFRAVVMDWRTKEERTLPLPVSAVSEDRTWAASVNYARLSLLRPDYGYAGPGQDAREGATWPEDDGIWTMDLATGETNLILSVAATRRFQPEPKAVPGMPGSPLAYHCHTAISRDGAKIFFLARSVDWYDKETHRIPRWNTTAFTINRDGTDLRRCFADGWAGSHFNWAPDGSHRLLATATWNERGEAALAGRAWSAVEFEVGREREVRRIGAGVLDLDWHCVYTPDGNFMSGETYWNKYGERPWVLVRLADGMTMPMGSFYVPEAYRGTYWRCDLHARFRPDGRQVAFNSVHEGSRQVYVRDIDCP